MSIKYDLSLSKSHTTEINSKGKALKNNPKSEQVSYSNVYGVTKGVNANNKYLDLIHTYQSALTTFSTQLDNMAQKFEELDRSEASQMRN